MYMYMYTLFEVESQQLLNEIARVTVDSLNTKAHNQMLGTFSVY